LAQLGQHIASRRVTVNQRMGELPSPARELEPVRLELVAVANACRSATSMGTAAWRHSMPGIDDRRLVSVHTVEISRLAAQA
jgi:hypothetical protein